MPSTTALSVVSLCLLGPIGGWLPAESHDLEMMVREAPPLQRIYQGRSFQPGEVVLVSLRSPNRIRTAQGTAFGKELSFSRLEEGGWQALIGIDLDTPEGKYPVRLRVSLAEAQPSTFEDVLVIRFKQFATRRLQVSAKYVNPPKEVLSRIQHEAQKTSAILAGVEPRRFWCGAFTIPVPGEPTSSFGRRSILNGQPRSPHSGTDFRAASGTLVKAPNGGRIAFASDLYFSGNTIILDHGQGLYSLFAHLSTISVSEGDSVGRGDLLGRVGSTGRVTGPHLHWSVRLNESRIDPLALMQVSDLTAASKDEERASANETAPP